MPNEMGEGVWVDWRERDGLILEWMDVGMVENDNIYIFINGNSFSRLKGKRRNML